MQWISVLLNNEKRKRKAKRNYNLFKVPWKHKINLDGKKEYGTFDT